MKASDPTQKLRLAVAAAYIDVAPLGDNTRETPEAYDQPIENFLRELCQRVGVNLLGYEFPEDAIRWLIMGTFDPRDVGSHRVHEGRAAELAARLVEPAKTWASTAEAQHVGLPGLHRAI
jgi:hypothetical protein